MWVKPQNGLRFSKDYRVVSWTGLAHQACSGVHDLDEWTGRVHINFMLTTLPSVAEYKTVTRRMYKAVNSPLGYFMLAYCLTDEIGLFLTHNCMKIYHSGQPRLSIFLFQH